MRIKTRLERKAKSYEIKGRELSRKGKVVEAIHKLELAYIKYISLRDEDGMESCAGCLRNLGVTENQLNSLRTREDGKKVDEALEGVSL